MERRKHNRFEIIPLKAQSDLERVRRAVARWAVEARFSVLDRTKIVTAASEIGRNTVLYGLGGSVRIEPYGDRGHEGFSLLFEDYGPGIADMERAMRGGQSTGTGLGLGLSGARRLCKRFEIHSVKDKGTRVRLIHWR